MRQRGHSLLEIVVCISLLSMVIVLVMNLFPVALTTLRHAENKYQASNLAKSVLDDWSSRPFASLTPGTLQNLNAVPVEGGVLQPVLEIYNVPKSDPNYLRSIRVDVGWSEKSSPYHTVQELWVHNITR